MTSPWGQTRRDRADNVIKALNTARNTPGHPGFLKQADLANAANVTHSHTFSEVVTIAATERVRVLHPGFAIMYSPEGGYRLADEATADEIRRERRRLRTVRTMMIRVVKFCEAQGNGPVLKMVGAQLRAVVTTVIMPALTSLDSVVGDPPEPSIVF